MTLEELFANITDIAANAYDDSDEDDVQSWDAYASAKEIVAAIQAYGYDVKEMLAEIAEGEE
jgi:hypothetical protein